MSPLAILFILICEPIKARIAGMPPIPDYLGKQVGIVIRFMRHIAANVEQDLQEFWPPVHLT